MKPEHKKMIGDLIDIFDDYEELNATKRRQGNVEACCDYNKHLFYRLCDMSKSDIFFIFFNEWYLNKYKTYDSLVDAAKKGKDDFLQSESIKLIKLSEITLTDIVYIFDTELREYFKDTQEEETQND